MNIIDENLAMDTDFSAPESLADSSQSRSIRTRTKPRPCDSNSIPSLSSFVSAKSNRTPSGNSVLSPCRSSPLLISSPQKPFNETERGVKTVSSGVHHEDDNELRIGEDEAISDASDMFSSSPNLNPDLSSNDESPDQDTDFHSIKTFNTSTSALSKQSKKEKRANEYSTKKSRNRPKRKISSWYQTKRDSFSKSYRDKVNTFKKIFDDTPVDTDRFLVEYSCALVKNKNGLLLLGKMYITDKWICFYSKIISELKLYLSVEDIQMVSKAKTARVIPNAIQITMKSNSERYFFTSFSSRERTFAFLKKVCENSRNGGFANMEELLSQVQDVYGDESLAVLDFEEGNDDDVYPPLNENVVSSSFEMNESTSISPLPTGRDSVDEASLSWRPLHTTDSIDRGGVRRRLRRRQQHHLHACRGGCASTDDESAAGGVTVAVLHRQQSVSIAVAPPGSLARTNTTVAMTSSLYAGGLSGSDTTPTSATTDDEAFDASLSVEDGPEGLEMNFTRAKSQEAKESRSGAMLRQDTVEAGNNNSQRGDGEGKLTWVDGATTAMAAAAGGTEEVATDTGEEQGPVSCGPGHAHSGQKYAELDVRLSVDALFACLFTDSQFFASFCAHRGTFDVEQSRWPPRPWPAPTSGDATLNRKISYVLTLKQRLGPRTCRAFESQTILLRETRPGLRYVLDAAVTNEAVPLCNSFHVTTRYCLLRRGPGVSHLVITSEVIYDRPVFFGAKSIIESTCRSNLTDNFTDLVNYLVAAVARLSDAERRTGGPLARPARPTQPVTRRGVAGGALGVAGGGGERSDAVGGRGSGAGTDVGGADLVDASDPDLQSARGLSIPQVLLYPNQNTDNKWLIVAITSLCLIGSRLPLSKECLERGRSMVPGGRLFIVDLFVSCLRRLETLDLVGIRHFSEPYMRGLGLCVLVSVVYNRYHRAERISTGHPFDFVSAAAGRSGSCCEELDSVKMLVKSVSTILSQMRTTLELLNRRLNQLESSSCRFSTSDNFLGN